MNQLIDKNKSQEIHQKSLETEIRELKFRNHIIAIKCKKIEQDVSLNLKLRQDLQDLARQLTQKNNIISNLKTELENFKSQSLEKMNFHLKEIEELEIQVKDKQKLEQFVKIQKEEIQNLKNKTDKVDMNQMVGKLDEFDSPSSKKHGISPNRRSIKSQQAYSLHSQDSETKQDFNISQKNDRKLHSVKLFDVEFAAEELRMRFQLNKITLDQVMKQFFLNEYFLSKKLITIKDVFDLMQSHPFNVRDNNTALLLARYLVEDNSGEYIIYKDTQKCDLKTISSRFKFMIKKYDLFTHEQDRQMHKQLSKAINENAFNLSSSFDSIPETKMTGKLSKKQLNNLLNDYYMIDEFSNNQILNYFFLQLFEQSNTLNCFYVKDIWELFKSGASKQIRKSTISPVKFKKDQDKQSLFQSQKI